MKSIIAVDMGGTNCRMGLFHLNDGQLYMDRYQWIDTSRLAGAEHFLQELDKAFVLGNAAALVIAIAGPVESNLRARLTNGTLELDFEKTPPGEDLKVSIINDFMAQAWAVLGPAGDQARHLSGPAEPLASTRGVIGAGTGLGQASMILLPDGRWEPVASENGHVGFPFITREEADLQNFMKERKNVPYITGDELINGSGLTLIHEFLTGQQIQPWEVGDNYLGSDTETLRWYSRFYARACKNWILSTLCRGGLWIAGGIAAKNPYTVTNDAFFEELYNARQWTPMIKSTPLFLMEDKNSGLWGSAGYALQMMNPDL